MSMIDLSNLSPEQIAQLRAVLGTTDAAAGARSPAWKPLSDMRPPTTAKGRLNRPHFEWSADPDGMTVIPDYPTLYWDGAGIEHRVESAEADATTPATWKPYPPSKAAIVDPLVKAQAEFDALSPDDQAFVIQAQKKARLNKLHEMMAGLSDKDLATLTAQKTTKK
jgi:hypothetical protein